MASWVSTMACLLVLTTVFTGLEAQAPGDEDDRCTVEHESPPTYPGNVKALMDSYHYVQLLPGSGTGNPPIEGAVWTDRSVDGNDVVNSLNPTYWQQSAGGICRWQVKACGFQQDGVDQDNWLFTQHISKDVDPKLDNYTIEIRINITNRLSSCRDRFGCNERFKVYRYMTNSPTSRSISSTGFMNTDNYERIKTIKPDETGVTDTTTVTFEMQPGETGFYLALRDQGTCVEIPRILVYRLNCAAFQDGLILYPDGPAPISGSAPVAVSCVNSAAVSSPSPHVSCSSDGEWGPETPTCGCSPGYEINLSSRDTCDICPEGEYQARVSDTHRCELCPGHSSSDMEATAVCVCDDNFFRLETMPDSDCVRSPSAPRFDLTSPPVLDGTDVRLTWRPSNDSGGDPDNLYYDIYTVQLTGEEFQYCRSNNEQIDDDCEGGTKCRFTLTGLDANTPYGVLIVAANSATNDDECIDDVTLLGSRYLVLVVGTEDAKTGLAVGPAVAITFFMTVIITAMVTSVIILAIVYLCIKHKYSHGHSGTSYNTTKVDLGRNEMHSPSLKEQEQFETAAKKPSTPARPMPPPAKPTPPRPTPPSRPPHKPAPHASHSPAYNGY